MGEDRRREVDAEASAFQVVGSPRVLALERRACRDELGREALEVRVVLGMEGPAAEAQLAGARAIWEALVERLTAEAPARFPYVRFDCRSDGEEAAR